MVIRSAADLVSFVSSRAELQPGDVIAAGAPEGVRTFQISSAIPRPDRVKVEVIGTLMNTVEETDEYGSLITAFEANEQKAMSDSFLTGWTESRSSSF